MSRRFIAFLLGAFILIGGAFFAMLRWGSQLSPATEPSAPPRQGGGYAPPIPVPPSVSLSVELNKKGNILHVVWGNLPANTVALDIFRTKKGKKDWSLWRVINLSPDELSNGSASFNIGSSTFSNYSFYIEAMGSAGGSNGTSTPGNVTWGSPVIEPVVSSSTPPASSGGGQSGSGSSPTSTPTSTGSGQNQNSSPPLSSSTQGGGGNAPQPTGTPYYTPQIQLSGYGNGQAASFWVQHVDQRIELGWQNLPPLTDNIIVLRTLNQQQNWDTVLTQQNPTITGPYSFQVVDNTLGKPYYYMMQAFAGSTTIATYGPVYLPPVGQ